MYKRIFACLCLLFCVGCLDAQVKPKLDTDVDVKSEIKSEVEAHVDSLLKAEINPQIESLVKTQLDSVVKAEVEAAINTQIETTIKPKMNVLGGDIQTKMENQFRDLNTKIQTSTQNQGMFSGGAVYVLILGCFIVATIAITIIYLVRELLKWKKLWHLVSHSIEVHTHKKDADVKQMKEHLGSMLEVSGLKHFVDQNLKKRGLNRTPRD